jgi:hypothetical protein
MQATTSTAAESTESAETRPLSLRDIGSFGRLPLAISRNGDISDRECRRWRR